MGTLISLNGCSVTNHLHLDNVGSLFIQQVKAGIYDGEIRSGQFPRALNAGGKKTLQCIMCDSKNEAGWQLAMKAEEGAAECQVMQKKTCLVINTLTPWNDLLIMKASTKTCLRVRRISLSRSLKRVGARLLAVMDLHADIG